MPFLTVAMLIAGILFVSLAAGQSIYGQSLTAGVLLLSGIGCFGLSLLHAILNELRSRSG